eukprot:scaffold320623_cov59-Attheya_sp.AAC.1
MEGTFCTRLANKPVGKNTLHVYMKVLGGIAIALNVAQDRSFGSQKPYARGSVATHIQTSIALGKHPRQEIELVEEVEEKKSQPCMVLGPHFYSTCNITKGMKKSCIIIS